MRVSCFVDLSRSRAGLRSSTTTNFAMPQLRTKRGERAFSHAGPAAWNALPEDMRAVSDSVLFRKRLKTHFLVLLLTFVDYCWLLLMTLVMHLCSPCNRRTINLSMMMMTMMMSKENKWVGSQQSWCKEGTARHCQSKEASILWSHHEETRELPGKRNTARNNARCTHARKTTHGLDRQHQVVDRTLCGRVSQNDRG